MKLKKVLASAMAAAMALTTMVTTSFTASAEGEINVASTSGISAKSVSINYSLSSDKENNWEYMYSNINLIVKTWSNSAGAGDWLENGLGGSNQEQYYASPKQWVATYNGTAITDTFNVNLTVDGTLDEFVIMYAPADVYSFTVNSVKAYSEYDSTGDIVWEYPEAEKPPVEDEIVDEPVDDSLKVNEATYEYTIQGATNDLSSISFTGATEKATDFIVKVASSDAGDQNKIFTYSSDPTALNYNANIKTSGSTTTLTLPSELIGYSDDATLTITVTVSTNTSLGSVEEVNAAIESGSIRTTDENASAIVLKAFEKKTAEEEPVVPASTVLWEGSTAVGNWEKWVEVAADKFTDISGEGKLVVTLADTLDAAQIGIRDGAWNNILDYSDNMTAGTTTFEYDITSDVLATLKSTGMIVTGHDFTITKIEYLASSTGGDNNGNSGGTTPEAPKPEEPDVIVIPNVTPVITVSAVPANSAKKFEITDSVTGKAISTSVNKLAKALSKLTEGSELAFDTGSFGLILRKNAIKEIVDNDLTLTVKTSKATFIIDAENLAKVKTINIPAIMKTANFKKLVKEGNTFNVIVTEKNKVEIELA